MNNSIGFLRFALASMVLYSHAHLLGGFGNEWLANWSSGTMIAGTFAVQSFFVLSGRLITTSWIRLHSLPVYLWRRALRLLPALWACLFVTAFVLAPLVSGPLLSNIGLSQQHPGPVSYLLRNLLIPRSQISIGNLLADNPWPSDWNGSLWTLFYEGACYLLIGLAGTVGLWTRWRRVGLCVLIGLLTGFVIVRLVGLETFPTFVRRLYDTPGKELCVHFVAGSLWGLVESMRSRLITVPMSIGLGSGAALAALWHLPHVHVSLSPLLVPCLIFWLADALPIRNWETWVGGDYSYGMYLFGYPVEQVVAGLIGSNLNLPTFLFAAFITTTALAVVSWHWIERPALSMKNFWARQAPPDASGHST